MEKFLSTCAAQNPNRRLRLIALADRVSMRVERADFDDLVTLVTQAPPWEKDRAAGVRILLRAIAEGKPDAPDQILARWTWRLSRAVRKQLDRKASQEYPDAKRLLGALANSRGHRHEENAAKLVNAALEMPRRSAPRCSPRPRATRRARRSCSRRRASGSATIQEVAGWIADNLPQPKTGPTRTRRRRRRKKKGGRRRRRRRPRRADGADGRRRRAARRAEEAPPRAARSRPARRRTAADAEAGRPEPPSSAAPRARRARNELTPRNERRDSDVSVSSQCSSCSASGLLAGHRHGDLAVRAARAADPARRRRVRPQAAADHRRARRSASSSSRSSRRGCSTSSGCRRTCCATSRSRCSS